MHLSTKAILGSFTAFSLILISFFAVLTHSEPEQTQTQTLVFGDEIKGASRPLASYDPLIVAPYKTLDVFMSEELASDFDFTSAGGYWDQTAPNGTNIEVEVRFKSNGQWSEWLELEEEEESENGDNAKKVAMAATNPAQSMQYKVLMYGDGKSVPSLKNMEWTFIRAAKNVSTEPVPMPEFAASNYSVNPASLTLNTGSASVITRSRWGANESYRYATNNDDEIKLINLDPNLYSQFKDELKYSKVVTKDSKGKKYKWPLQYPEKVKKFIIHHTATTNNLDNPEQAIRDIYYYHAMTRGWGDIGYNYLIDKKGKIYEGRYGGDGVIGAHAGIGNNGSVGIAVLGNYESSKLPDQAYDALVELIAEKSGIHKIDPAGKSKFRSKNMSNVFGHKDIMATTCPGQYIYKELSSIASDAAKGGSSKSKSDKKSGKKDYDYDDKSKIREIELDRGETRTIEIKLKNKGKITWNDKTYLYLNNAGTFNGIVSFPNSSRVQLATMKESKVSSNKTATFKFEIQGGNIDSALDMRIVPVVNGVQRMEELIIPITVEQGNYKYSVVNSYLPKNALSPGETFQAWVKLKNEGDSTWYNSGTNKIVLRSDHPKDRISKVVAPYSNIIGNMQEGSVAPGKTGTFNISISAPNQPGTYQEYYTPYVENFGWLIDGGNNFEVKVTAGKYAGAYNGMSGSRNWQRGKAYTIWLKLENTGSETWTKDNMKISFLKGQNLVIKDQYLGQKEVKTGEIGTIYFTAVVDANENYGQKSIQITPTVKGNHILKSAVKFDYSVTSDGRGTSMLTLPRTANAPAVASLSRPAAIVLPSSSATSATPSIAPTPAPVSTPSYVPAPTPVTNTIPDKAEGKIRVKISYSGNPQITATGGYSIWAGSKNLANPKANQLTTVKYENGSYKVSVNGETFSSNFPVRFGPSGSSILRIDNFSRPTSWNANLNDNEFRGVLEVREDGGKLIVINDLPLEDYMKGLAEVPNDELTEKMKAILIAARTYAKYYMEVDQKFPGKPYTFEDDPNTSQKYLGYGFEKRAQKVVKAVEETRGEVVTYKGTLVKTPYFSQSDGVATKNAKEVWGWNTPYLVSVNDKFCTTSNGQFAGHGVGMSGCGSRGMAAQGYGYKEILKYYYTGVEIADLY